MKRDKSNKYQATYTTKYEYRKMSWRQLTHDFRVLANQANSILREVEKKKLRNYGASYSRKWNAMLFGDTIPNLGTTRGRFSTKLSAKENLIERMQAMEEFINNPHVQAKAIQKDLNELANRLNMKDTDMLLKLFDIYRDYGFESYKDDSDRMLIAFSEVANKGGDMEAFAKLIEKVEAIDNITQEEVVAYVENFRDYYNAYDKWNDADKFARANMYNSVKTKEQRKIAAKANVRRTFEARRRIKAEQEGTK